MAIYRGPGGAGDATNDATSQAILAAQSAQDAAASQAAAAASASSASTSASNSATSATNAASSASTATTQANNAASSASSAATSASTATTKASEASTSATNAASSASAASTSATAAASSASAASTSASAASTSATNAATSATTASTQASNAASSASAASTSATNAASSASAASTSATNAAASATSAGNSATSASASATSATASAATATTKAAESLTNATNAANSATAAATSATNAANSATTATTQATNAATSATNASNSASSAAASAAAAAASYDNFDDRYLGTKSTPPTLDNDGNALVTGALYYNDGTSVIDNKGMWVYDGAQWLPASAASQAILVTYKYVATAGQTTFSGADSSALTLSYTPGSILVTLNGVILDKTDYTATTGTSVVLGTGAVVNDEVAIYAFSTFDVANTYTQAQADSRFFNVTGDSISGNLAFTGTGNRITGDFSNATLSNRVLFQSSTTNGNTGVYFIPNGTAGAAALRTTNSSDISNNSFAEISAGPTAIALISGINGTGSYLPMTFSTNNAERMRLDTSGNVGIGCSPSSKLEVAGEIKAAAFGGEGGQIVFNNPDNTTQGLYIDVSAADKGRIYSIRDNSELHLGQLVGTGGIISMSTSATERLRILSDGKVGIGTGSPARKLEVSDNTNSYNGINITNNNAGTSARAAIVCSNGTSYAAFGQYGTGAGNNTFIEAAGPFVTLVGGSERTRIDTSGNFLVGTATAVNSTNTIWINKASQALVIQNAGTYDSSFLVTLRKAGTTNSTSQRYMDFQYNSGANGNGGIAGNGDAQCTFITASDERLKENIEDLSPQLNNILSLRPVEFDYIKSKGHQIGFIAQEVQKVYPDLISKDDDGFLNVAGLDKNTARLIKAIQELEARVKELENK